MTNRPIYLDYNATTPVDPQVLEAMIPYFSNEFGNASSLGHDYGRLARAAVEQARKSVAELVASQAYEIYLTSGATESINLCLQGVARYFLDKGEPVHFITSKVEHKATLLTCEALEKTGIKVTYLDVNRYGQVSAKQVAEAITKDTKLVSLIMANNEVGSLNPIAEIGSACKESKILFHVDAAQGVGKFAIDVNAMNIDYLSLSGHKIYGPKGVGALYKRQHAPLTAINFGGSQEYGLRPGTLNVPAIVGMGKACEIYSQTMTGECERITKLRDLLVGRVLSEVPSARLNGHPTERLCNNASFSFANVSPDAIAIKLKGFALSSGSACNTGCGQPSHVLMAMGHPPELASSTVRIGIGRTTSEADIIQIADKIKELTN